MKASLVHFIQTPSPVFAQTAMSVSTGIFEAGASFRVLSTSSVHHCKTSAQCSQHRYRDTNYLYILTNYRNRIKGKSHADSIFKIKIYCYKEEFNIIFKILNNYVKNE
jgi:hypothetical protein